MRRSFTRYVARQAFGSKSLNRKAGRRGSSSLFDSFNSFTSAKQVSGGRLDNDLWEQNYTEVIESQEDKAGNSGQETLLGPDYFQNSAKDYCKTVSKDYDPEKFISFVKDKLGDTYYYAINEIIDECAEELLEAWDSSYSGDGLGEKLFGVYQGGGRRVYGSFSNAVTNYSARAAARYGANWNTVAGARARSAAAATKFLSANPGGRPRASIASAGYKAAAARNGIKLP